MAETQKPPLVITKDVLIPVGIVGSVISFGLVGLTHFNSWAVNDALWKERTATRVQAIETTVQRMDSDLDNATADRWRRGDMRSWATELDERNPNIDVPRVP